MAFIPLSLLPTQLRRAYGPLRGAFRLGLPVPDAVRMLRRLGIRGTRRQVQSLHDSYTAEAGAGLDISRLRRSYRPNVLRMPEAITPLLRNFSFTIRLRGTNVTTGSFEERFVTVASSRNLTRGEMEDRAAALVQGLDGLSPFRVAQATPVEARRAGTEGRLL